MSPYVPQFPVPLRPAEDLDRPSRPVPPMRQVTKGWFTMRGEAKTLEELQAVAERERTLRR